MTDARLALKHSKTSAAAVPVSAGLDHSTGTLVSPAEPSGATDCDASTSKHLTAQDEGYFVTALELFTLPRFSELGHENNSCLRRYINDDKLPTCKFWRRYCLRLAEGGAAGNDPGAVDEGATGALVQLDAAMDGLDTKRYDASRINGCYALLVSEYELRRWAKGTYFGSGNSRHSSIVMAPSQS